MSAPLAEEHGRPPSLHDREGRVFTKDLLDACIACGFCLPACPTYTRTGQETSSPRGRISLMRALEAGQLEAGDPGVREESSFCLGCRACEPVCPAGVQYGALLEEWRDRVWTPRRRPLKLRGLLWAVDAGWRVRAMGLVRRHAERRRGAAEGAQRPSGTGATDGGQRRAHLMLGCFERALFPRVSRAAAVLDPGLEVTPAQGCCGALHAHNGELERGEALARELGEQLPGTIVTTSGGCAAHMAAVLGRERVRELSQWMTEARAAGAAAYEREEAVDPGPGPDPPASGHAPSADGGGPRRPRIALQDSCHLRNGLGVSREPRELIGTVGEYVELPSAGECCGAAGTYAILRPRDSRRVLDDKVREIADAGVDIVATVNPGCYRQIEQGVKRAKLQVEVVHLAELLARERGAAR